MIRFENLKADMKQITQEPIMVLFMILPIFVFIIFKILLKFLFPWINELTGFDISLYNGYVLAVSLLMVPDMLGTVIGFLMIDERDEHIFELMSITPLGYSGYMLNRFLIPFLSGIVYTILGYHILNIYQVNFGTLMCIAVLIGLQGVIIGLMLFQLSEDKVQGLTYSKAMGIFMLFSLADLLGTRWISIAASFFPFYWVSRLILYPVTFWIAALILFVHGVWICGLIKINKI